MSTIAPIHPGEHLAEILEELGITQYRLAKAIGTPPRRINEIVRSNRSVTADTALRIGKALGTTPEYWLNLQRMYDLDLARSSTDVARSNRWSVSSRDKITCVVKSCPNSYINEFPQEERNGNRRRT